MNVLKRGMKWAQQYCHSAAVSIAYLCLHHGHSVGPHVRHQAQYIHELVVTDVLQEPIQGYECPRPSHASAATHTHMHLISGSSAGDTHSKISGTAKSRSPAAAIIRYNSSEVRQAG